MGFIDEHYFYLRGVSNFEANESLNGRNGQVSKSQALTNRGSDETRLAFRIAKDRGIDFSVLNEFKENLYYYATLGAHAEVGINPREHLLGFQEQFQGQILIFALKEKLQINTINLNYGDNWRTTSILPNDADLELLGIMTANFDDAGSVKKSFKPIEFKAGMKYKESLGNFVFEDIFDFEQALLELIKIISRKLD